MNLILNDGMVYTTKTWNCNIKSNIFKLVFRDIDTFLVIFGGGSGI